MIRVPQAELSERLLTSILLDRIVLAAIVSLIPYIKNITFLCMTQPFGAGTEEE
jgi:hypothetical protein